MNTPASSSHPSPGSHPDRPNTPVSRMSLNEISLRARFIQDEKLNEIIKIGIHQRRLWIGQLQREVRTLSQNQVDPKILEEMKNKMEIAVAEAQQYKDQNIILESDLRGIYSKKRNIAGEGWCTVASFVRAREGDPSSLFCELLLSLAAPSSWQSQGS
ncbi:hypothetical protein Nepgr_008515 [Nepenthes gracilis]|uniref:Uncharacterized protein n=1 Tax=Nepenthes gracilis TaxID=150966 RepID=A0AAD3XJG2_NEPGR|nr:hypothetical protein Nepgr_008515 [Nepenthes gracilis]